MEDDDYPQQEPAPVIRGLHHCPPEEREGEAGVPAAAGQKDAVPGSGSGSGQMPRAALPVQSRRANPEQ